MLIALTVFGVLLMLGGTGYVDVCVDVYVDERWPCLDGVDVLSREIGSGGVRGTGLSVAASDDASLRGRYRVLACVDGPGDERRDRHVTDIGVLDRRSYRLHAAARAAVDLWELDRSATLRV